MANEDELARERQEVQRLRGLLIERDAELGNALGRLAELEGRSSKRLAGVVKKIAGALRRS